MFSVHIGIRQYIKMINISDWEKIKIIMITSVPHMKLNGGWACIVE